jgi:cell division septation protein DedD
VCLIEGAVKVGAEGEQAVTLDKPRQFYRRDMGKTQPVGFVGANQIAEWAKQTEIEAGKGALRRGGRFSVQLAAADNEEAARAVRDELHKAGYPAEIARRQEAEKVIYYVRIRQLPSREEAQALAAQLKGKHGVGDPRVSG